MRLSLFVVALSIATPTLTHGASRLAKNRCSDARVEVVAGTTHVFDDVEVWPDEINKATAHIKQHVDRYERAIRLMNSAGEWDPKDPELAECTEPMEKTRAYIEATTKKIAAAQAEAKQEAPILAAATDASREAFRVLLAAALGKGGFGDRNLEQAKALVASLEPVERACATAMPEAGGKASVIFPPGSSAPRLAGRGKFLCLIATNRSGFAKRALETQPPAFPFELELRMMRDGRDRWGGPHNNWVIDMVRDEAGYVAEWKKATAPWYETFGVTMPDELVAKLREQIGELRAALVAAAGRRKVTAGSHHDPGLESAAKKQLSGLYKTEKKTVLGSWMHAAGWTIDQNKFGIPVSRYRSGSLVYKVAGDPWCFEADFNIVESHMGGGRYAKTPAPSFLGRSVCTCP